MGIKTGEEYINKIKSRKPEVWLGGRVVEDIYNEPIFKQPIQEIAKLYDIQHDPEYQDEITHICKETGERVNNAFLFPKTSEDLQKRSKLFEVYARMTYGLMGRTPDFLNVVVTSTGIGWALAFGRIGAIVAPTLIGLLLAANYSPQNAFMAFTVPSIMAALALLAVKERHGSYDKLQLEGNIKLKATSNV